MLAREVETPPLADGIDQQQAPPVLGIRARAHRHGGQRAGIPDQHQHPRAVSQQPQPHRGRVPVRPRYLHGIRHQLRDHQLRAV